MLIFRLLDIGPRPSLPKTKKHKKTRLETGLRLRGRVPPFPSKPHIFQSSHTHLPFSRQVNPYAKSFLASRGSEHGRILVQVVFFALMPSSPCHAHVAMWPRLPCGHVAMPCCLVGSGRQTCRVQECSGQAATQKPPQSRLRGAASPYKLLKRLATAAGGVMTWLGLGRGLRDRVGVRSHGQGEGWDSGRRAGWSGRRGDHGGAMVMMG